MSTIFLETVLEKVQRTALLKNELVQTFLGIALLAVSAQVCIHLPTVPISLQTVAVLLIGLFYPTRTAIKTMLGYLGFGALGFPVFAEFYGGWHVFLMSSAGYLWGFLAAVAAMCYFREKVKVENYFTQLLNCILGTVIIYACGISWLALFVGFTQAIKLGLLPFIIPGCVKSFILAYATHSIKSKQGK